MSFVIFDTEYTTWEGCLEKGWTGQKKKEVVQLSALKISDKLEVLAEFSALCKPSINPILSDYFVNLTHITNEQVNKSGEAFSTVYNNFVNFVGNDTCYSHVWNADFIYKADGEIIENNILLYNLSIQQSLTYRNIAPIFKKLYEENKISVTHQSSGQIAAILGLDKKIENLGLNPHNAFYDVYSIYEGMKYFYPQSVELLKYFERM